MAPWPRLCPVLFSIVLLIAFCVAHWGKRGFALSAFGDLAELGFLLVAATFMIRNAFASHGAARIFWLFSSAGIAFWIFGVAQWTEYEIVLRVSAPQTPVGDTLLFLKLVPLVAALAIEPQSQLTRRFRILGFLDFSFLLVYWFYCYAMWVIPYRFVVNEDGVYSFHFNTIDALGLIIFFSVLGIVALRAQGAWRNLYRLYWASFALYTLSSMIANVAIDEGKYYSGSLYDLPLLTSVAGIAYFAILGGNLPVRSAPSPLTGVHSKSSRAVVLLPARIAMLATLSTPLIGFALLGSTGLSDNIGRFRVLATFLAMLILTALLSLKQDLLSTDLICSLREANLAHASLSNTHQRLLQIEKLASLGQVVARVANVVKKAVAATLNSSAALIKDAAAGLSPAGQKPRVQLEIKSEGAIPMVAADSSRILQVFLQIIGNGVDAVEEKGSGSLIITLCVVHQHVEVEFADSGGGLLEPEHVFDPFYTTKGVGKGVGLGLSTCYGIVRQHGGDISCRDRVGGGAVFTVSLPAAREGASRISLPNLAPAEES